MIRVFFGHFDASSYTSSSHRFIKTVKHSMSGARTPLDDVTEDVRAAVIIFFLSINYYNIAL